MKVEYDNNTIHLSWESDTPLDRMEIEQAMVLIEALKLYSQRNTKYRDNWRRMGWRGLLIRIRERSDRLWDTFWTGVAWKDPERDADDSQFQREIDADDALDLINFAAFFVRQARMADEEGWMIARDGEWWIGV